MGRQVIPLEYYQGDGVSLNDCWILDNDGWLFMLFCEGVEWMGRIVRPDGRTFWLYAYGRGQTPLADIDPQTMFSLELAWDNRPLARCCLVEWCRECPRPTTAEILMLNRIKRQVFDRHADQITTGVTTR